MIWSLTSDYEDAMVISNTWFVGYTRNRLYGILSPKVTYGSAFGGGGSGIGGIKSTMEIHEFCIVRSLKLCSFLGCKWGVPLVIGGGWLARFGSFGTPWSFRSFWSLWASCSLITLISYIHIVHKQCSCSSVSDALILLVARALCSSTLIVTTLYS